MTSTILYFLALFLGATALRVAVLHSRQKWADPMSIPQKLTGGIGNLFFWSLLPWAWFALGWQYALGGLVFSMIVPVFTQLIAPIFFRLYSISYLAVIGLAGYLWIVHWPF